MAADPVDPEPTSEPDATATPEAAAGPVDDIPVEGPTATDKADKATKTEKTADKGATKPAAPVVRKKVVSKRVTPKGGPTSHKGATKGSTAARTRSVATEHDVDDDDAHSKRYTPPTTKYAPGPSPWWVPAIMFGLLIIGALIIMLNYMSAFGEPANIRLVIGLAFILGGIITATQYR